MKILVVGVGSIGYRHAINVAELAELGVVDTDELKADKVAKETGSKSFGSNLEEALKVGYQAVIIAVPHRYHIEVAQQAIESGADVLIEKPISHDYEQASQFLKYAKSLNRKVFVVCNMRFHPAISLLKELLPKIGTPLFSRAHYGNYLPDMRPGIDYRSLYVANADEGGVLLDGIHELDYLSWLFGPIQRLTADVGHISKLDIAADDYAAMILKHQSGIRSEVHLDYLRRVKRRGCEISGTDGMLLWASEGKSPEHCTVQLFQPDTGWETVLEIEEVNNLLPLQQMMQSFILALQQDRHNLQTGDEAIILLKATLAARSGSKIVQTLS